MSRPELFSWWSVGAACAALVAFCAASCGSGARARTAERVRVVSHSPSGTSHTDSPIIVIEFDRAVVPEQAVGALVEPLPVAIDPPIDARARWTDRRTLEVMPTSALVASRYTVSLNDELADDTNGFHFAFLHAPAPAAQTAP